MRKVENTQLSFDICIKGEKWNIQVNNSPAIKTYGQCFIKERVIDISVHLVVKCLKENKLEKLEDTVRHELIHAFLLECGLEASSHSYDGAWAMNEEVVDWFAKNIPFINKAVTEVMTVFLQEAEFLKTFSAGQDGVFEDEMMDMVIEKALTKKLQDIFEGDRISTIIEQKIEGKLVEKVKVLKDNQRCAKKQI